LATETDGEKSCPSCRGNLTSQLLFSIDAFYQAFEPSKAPPKKDKTKNDKKEQIEEDWISSTKIDKLMEVLMETRRTHPDDKTIVFSQFLGMLDLIEVPLKRNGFGFVRVCLLS
jgi:SNF2 family DNA or RNA helicase